MRKLLITVILVAAATSIGLSQGLQQCADFMKFGIYDKYQTFSSELRYNQIKEFFKSFNFSSKQNAETKANELGLNLFDILGLQFNGKNSSTHFEQWQQELIKSSYQEGLNAGLKLETVEKVSDNITKIVQTCLMQKGVHAYIIPSSDNRNFSFTIDFLPHTGSKSTAKGSFTVTPSSVAATGMPKGLIGQQLEIGPQGVSINMMRLPSETVTITYNTDEGAGTIHYNAFVTPKPTIQFKGQDDRIKYGQSSRLTWHVDNAQRVELDGVQVSESGSKAVYPEQTTEYRLAVISLDGQRIYSTVTLYVTPPPPKLVAARVHFHTTDDDKDDDTNVTVNILFGGNTIATVSNTFGKFDDNSDSGWKDLRVIEQISKEVMIGSSRAQLIEGPKGHDEWHFNWSLELTFSDGSVARYDWGGGNVDHDRTTITQTF
jgi:hypothetical protein